MSRFNEDRPQITPILNIIRRSSTVKSIFFHNKLLQKAYPGQFAMIWLPDVDEIPMSITTSLKEDSVEIIVKVVGEATEKIHELKQGEVIGVRGPYGNWFKINQERNVLVVVGGTGITPLRNLAIEQALTRNITLVLGGSTKAELLFLNELERARVKVYPTTDDGTMGFKGSASQLGEQLIKQGEFDLILSCGPETMIRSLADSATKHEVSMQASLERIMKCGFGICGSCALDKYRVCKDGPVFDLPQLIDMKEELGKIYRDQSGHKLSI
jgi:dihydroorotate dehydrogenase electron transfer subunit